MPGMYLGGGATALVGRPPLASSAPLTSSPVAPTTATTASGIAFSGSATPAGGEAAGLGPLFTLSAGSVVFWTHVALWAYLAATYLSLPS